MAFCERCGQQIPDDAYACPYCGTVVNAQYTQQNYSAPQQQSYDYSQQQGYSAPQQQSYDYTQQQGYGAPRQQSYDYAQQQGYGAPQQQSYDYAQQQGYGAPQQQSYDYAQQAAPQQQAAPRHQSSPRQQTVLSPEMDVQQNKGITWIAYLGILISSIMIPIFGAVTEITWVAVMMLLLVAPTFVLVMLIKRRSPYAQFHVKQAATLYAFEFAYSFTYFTLIAIFQAIFPFRVLYDSYSYNYYSYSSYSYSVGRGTAYTILAIIFSLIFAFFGVLAVMGIINAASGKKNQLFLIGKIPFIGKLLDNTVFK